MKRATQGGVIHLIHLKCTKQSDPHDIQLSRPFPRTLDTFRWIRWIRGLRNASFLKHLKDLRAIHLNAI